MTLVRDPLRTLSVSEPGGPGGCEKRRRATAEQTAVAAGCLYAQNAGFFTGTSDRRLGDVVSDGRMVRDSGGQQNAQFGIRKDGSLVFGYLSQEDVLDRSNPFVQLVSGVVWLLRKGEIYINQSLKAECDDTVEHEEFRDFVDVLSARTVVGHDADGDLILFHVDGKSKKRGMNLWEVADFLKKNGVIDAINLDGGGSSSFVINGTLASYPPDRCKSDSRWRCARDVSTVLCVHRRRCEPADRGGHGDCVNGRRRCQQGWRGAACDSLVCRPPACGPHGVCSANGCVCDAGWRGKNCSQALVAMAAELIQKDLTLTRRVGEKVSFSCGNTDQCYYNYVFWYQKKDTETFRVILLVEETTLEERRQLSTQLLERQTGRLFDVLMMHQLRPGALPFTGVPGSLMSSISLDGPSCVKLRLWLCLLANWNGISLLYEQLTHPHDIHLIRASTSASRNGIPEHRIQIMGCWSSQAYHRYICSELKDLRSAQSHLK
ncbi:N-acetylglucosamine-1-phosphodiester alpha-N-acetylglucosaminidase-like [Symphorus nematophorus]